MKRGVKKKKAATRTAKKATKKTASKTTRKKTAAKPKKKTAAKSRTTAKRKTVAAKKSTAKKSTAKKTTAKKTTAKKTAAKKTTAKRSAAAPRKAPAAPKEEKRQAPVIPMRETAAPSPSATTTSPAPPPAAPPMPAEQPIGVVTHYYSHLSVAVVQLNEGPLRVGEPIHIKGHTTDLRQSVESMEVDHQSVQEASAGQIFGLKVRDHVREHDQIFRG